MDPPVVRQLLSQAVKGALVQFVSFPAGITSVG